MSSNVIDREERTEYLTFFVRGEEYGIDLRRVREVISYDTLTRIPKMPPAVRGVTNLRGQVVPVLDLGIKFHGRETAVDKRTCIVLVESVLDGNPTVLGLITEAVGQVIALVASEIMPTPTFGAPIRIEFLAGMGRVGKKFALLLDIERLLAIDELLSAQTVEPADIVEMHALEPEALS